MRRSPLKSWGGGIECWNGELGGLVSIGVYSCEYHGYSRQFKLISRLVLPRRKGWSEERCHCKGDIGRVIYDEQCPREYL